MSSFTQTITYEFETCCSCHITFAVTSDFQRARLGDHKTFYCPNGHGQSFIGKTEAQRERERAARLERLIEQRDRALANRDEDLRSARASLTATKGQLTKAKKRAANGVCPCCNRSFANVKRHIDSQHPEHVAEVSQ